jgi:hypothetical protein
VTSVRNSFSLEIVFCFISQITVGKVINYSDVSLTTIRCSIQLSKVTYQIFLLQQQQQKKS